MKPQNGSPVPAAERAVVIDAVRGVALFGVLTVNLITEFRVSIFAQFLPQRADPGRSAADAVIASIVTTGLESKAFILFSLLFGVGLAVQQERTQARGGGFATYVGRRIGMLLAMGLVHQFLVWNGDILTLYAVLGFVAAPLMRWPVRVLLPLALGLFVLVLLPIPFPHAFPSSEATEMHVAVAHEIYQRGSFLQILAFRIHELGAIYPLLIWSAPRTLGLFLLGSCAWRTGLFGPGARPALLFAIAVMGVGGGIAAACSAGENLGRWGDVLSSIGPIFLALGYGASVVLAFREPHLARVLVLVAPLGRMALTNYLTQSVVLSALFYGWGLGLFDRLRESSALLIVVALFAAQAVFSTLWLKRYAFGPVEWLWRSFTYGAWQPMRR